MGWLAEDGDRLRRFRQGEPETLREVYLHYAPLLSQKLPRVAPSDLADIVQETFLRAFAERARLGYDATQPYLPYLLAIARNLAIDEHRKRVRIPEVLGRRPTSDEGGGQERPSSDPGPEAVTLHKQLLALYERFLKSQDELSRTVWRLRFVEGCSRREIQDQTGLSAKKVRTLERNLRKRLYELLQQSGYPVPDSADLVMIAMLVGLLTRIP